MHALQRLQLKFARSDGATAAEYAIMAFLIGVAVIVSVAAVGDRLVDLFAGVGEALADMIGG